MATAGLKQGAISIDESNLVCGGGITIGNKFTRCMGGNHGAPNVHVAIMKSCDGYFYRLGLKMKLEGIQAMVDMFDLDKQTGIDLPHEVTSTPRRHANSKPVFIQRILNGKTSTRSIRLSDRVKMF